MGQTHFAQTETSLMLHDHRKRKEVMNSRDFFDMVCRMRKAQKSYFKTRDRDALNLSKEIEKQVDEEINRVNSVLAKKGMPYISLEN